MECIESLIIEQLKRGEEAAYRYLYQCHYAVLCHVANGYVGDRFLAETLVGDVIFHVWEIRETLTITASIRSYLLRAVRNRCLNYLATEQVRKEIAFSGLDTENGMPEENRIPPSDLNPLGKLLEKELEEQIFQTIAQMPDECRRVFEKSRFEGKSYEEISSELGISVNTVKYHIKNALSFLNKNLGKYLLLLLLWICRGG